MHMCFFFEVFFKENIPERGTAQTHIISYIINSTAIEYDRRVGSQTTLETLSAGSVSYANYI